jgi:hypothetical protein
MNDHAPYTPVTLRASTHTKAKLLAIHADKLQAENERLRAALSAPTLGTASSGTINTRGNAPAGSSPG